jgi:deoxycytidylate deaminase
MRTEFDEFETKIFYLLNATKMLSECKDKQVAAIATVGQKIIGLSHNIPVNCNSKCDHTCTPLHAEEGLNLEKGCTVWLNLFPCEDCQRYLYNNGVAEVKVFGVAHKTIVPGQESMKITHYANICNTLLDYNGAISQKLVAAGECGELITAIMDSFRNDRECNNREIMGEVVDVMLQLFMISDNTFNEAFRYKVNKLIWKFIIKR